MSLGLGSLHDVSLKDARIKRDTARQQVRAGVDIVEAKRSARLEQKATETAEELPTFEQCAQRYIDENWSKWSKKHWNQWPSSLASDHGSIDQFVCGASAARGGSASRARCVMASLAVEPTADPLPIEIDPRPCSACGLTIDQHQIVDTPEGPEFYCDEFERLVYLRAAEQVAQWEMADPRDSWRHTGERPPRPDTVPNATVQPYRTAQSTIDAFRFLVSLADPRRLLRRRQGAEEIAKNSRADREPAGICRHKVAGAHHRGHQIERGDRCRSALNSGGKERWILNAKKNAARSTKPYGPE